MRFPTSVGVVVLALGGGAGCGGGGSSGLLDCAWLAGQNCWKTTVQPALGCLPPGTETGTLSADLRTCRYASGTVVTFDPALVLPLPDDWNLRFEISSGGTSCLEFAESDSGFAVTVGNQTYRETLTGALLTVTCPDGTSRSASVFDLVECAPDGGLFEAGLPGHSAFGGDILGLRFITVDLLSVSDDTSSSLTLFDCMSEVATTSGLNSTAAATARRGGRTRTPGALRR